MLTDSGLRVEQTPRRPNVTYHPSTAVTELHGGLCVSAAGNTDAVAGKWLERSPTTIYCTFRYAS
ncbi:MAG: hypothetical protein OET44_14965 [Gammaproteobacteria bacterium]|nr:hypothetical protein [Gammaproteobacteria bacterium]